MQKLTEKLKEPFEQQLDEQSRLLASGWAEFEDHKEIVHQWSGRKSKVVNRIIKTMKQWIADLKKMARPFHSMKSYKREKRRLKRAKFVPLFSWGGFRKGLQLALLEILNITRILLILSVYIGVILLLGFLIIKVIGFFGVG